MVTVPTRAKRLKRLLSSILSARAFGADPVEPPGLFDQLFDQLFDGCLPGNTWQAACQGTRGGWERGRVGLGGVCVCVRVTVLSLVAPTMCVCVRVCVCVCGVCVLSESRRSPRSTRGCFFGRVVREGSVRCDGRLVQGQARGEGCAGGR